MGSESVTVETLPSAAGYSLTLGRTLSPGITFKTTRERAELAAGLVRIVEKRKRTAKKKERTQ